MQVHLVDGTYELFRYFFALPSHENGAGEEVAATRGVVGSCLGLLEDGATHVGVATDHVIESFRNELYDGYKDGSGIDPDIFAQFPLVEEALTAAGFVVWPMVEYEADDALGAGALQAAGDDRIEQVLICTPDKDLGQCVGGKVVQYDRRKELLYDTHGVREKFGVEPESIPDYLALVGDSADGFPGLQGWGAKSAATVLARYGHIEDIPAGSLDWDVTVRSAGKLAATLQRELELALLFRRIATLETGAGVIDTTVDDLHWTGPTDGFAAWCDRLDAPGLCERAAALAATRS
jgi:5'-3' exonuclease